MRPRTKLEELCRPGAMRIEFQPIVRITDAGVQLYALEALTRGPSGSTMTNPAVLFEYARRKRQETQIDIICIAQALEAASSLPGDPLISINVHGSTLSEVPNFAGLLIESALAFAIGPRRLMLEIVEHRVPWVMDAFRKTLDELRRMGVRIAIDDLGVGSSNYHLFVDCRPDHIKIDRYIVNGCARDSYRLGVLRSIVTLGQACDAIPIAEGVERDDDLAALRGLGIDCVQGWLYAASMPAEEITRSSFFDSFRESSSRMTARNNQTTPTTTEGSIR
jgi:EAL domain-containing protein (putative c-di-GMP-specific phosphodiesterase class I)